MYLCLVLLYMTLFMSHFIAPCEVSEGIVSLSVPVLLPTCLPFTLTLFFYFDLVDNKSGCGTSQMLPRLTLHFLRLIISQS